MIYLYRYRYSCAKCFFLTCVSPSPLESVFNSDKNWNLRHMSGMFNICLRCSTWIHIPSAKLTLLRKITTFHWSTINGPFSIAFCWSFPEGLHAF